MSLPYARLSVVRGLRAGVRKDTEHPVFRNIIDVRSQNQTQSGHTLDTCGIFGGFTSVYYIGENPQSRRELFEFVGAERHETKYWMYAPGTGGDTNYLGSLIGGGGSTGWQPGYPIGRVYVLQSSFDLDRVEFNPVIKSAENWDATTIASREVEGSTLLDPNYIYYLYP